MSRDRLLWARQEVEFTQRKVLQACMCPTGSYCRSQAGRMKFHFKMCSLSCVSSCMGEFKQTVPWNVWRSVWMLSQPRGRRSLFSVMSKEGKGSPPSPSPWVSIPGYQCGRPRTGPASLPLFPPLLYLCPHPRSHPSCCRLQNFLPGLVCGLPVLPPIVTLNLLD